MIKKLINYKEITGLKQILKFFLRALKKILDN